MPFSSARLRAVTVGSSYASAIRLSDSPRWITLTHAGSNTLGGNGIVVVGAAVVGAAVVGGGVVAAVVAGARFAAGTAVVGAAVVGATVVGACAGAAASAAAPAATSLLSTPWKAAQPLAATLPHSSNAPTNLALIGVRVPARPRRVPSPSRGQ